MPGLGKPRPDHGLASHGGEPWPPSLPTQYRAVLSHTKIPPTVRQLLEFPDRLSKEFQQQHVLG